MTTQDIRYILERYRSGGRNRYICPQCGRKRCFTRYVDVETGEYLAEDCGICDHKSSCGYHNPPREFFRDHPEMKSANDNTPEFIGGKPVLALSWRKPNERQKTVPIVTPRHQEVFFPLAWAEKATLRTSTFRKWVERLPMDKEQVELALNDYYVGGSAKDIVVEGVNYGPAVVFWMIDEQGRVHDAKLMAYNGDGHRIANWGNSMRAICERTKRGPQLLETEKVLFGLHLLSKYPEKTVCIVESEKTAIICACRYPEFVWLATGGCGNLQREKLLPLMDRRVVVYPDSGEYERWKELMQASGHRNFRVVDFMEQYEPNTDIADILTGEAELKLGVLLPPPCGECPF